MDREQAKLILTAACSGEEFPEGDPRLENALALLESDPALAEWFAAQNELDEPMREALRTIEPPAHLRESILAAAKVTPFPARPKPDRLFPILWMAAAGFVALAAIVSIFLVQNDKRLTVAQLNAEIPRLTAAHEHSFESATGDLDAVRSWLAAHGGEANFVLPEGLKNHGAVACEVASVAETKVTILCFPLAGRHAAHLYVVNRSHISNAPPADVPSMGQDGEYAVASWSRGDQSYFLATKGEPENLLKLL